MEDLCRVTWIAVMVAYVGRGRAFLTGVLSCLAVGLLAVPVAAAAAVPSLRLFSPVTRVSISQEELRAGFFDPGVWVASVGGAFQVDMKRPGYGSWIASQVDSTSGTILRSVPPTMVDPAGLKRFFGVTFVSSRGRVAARRVLAFCPNGESARVSDAGPQDPTYPSDCATGDSFPFVRGIVWGLDAGWAVEPSLGSFAGFPLGLGLLGGSLPPTLPACLLRRLHGGFDLKPGRYTVTVSIARAWRRLFSVPAGRASVVFGVQVLASPVRKPSCPRVRVRAQVRHAAPAPSATGVPTLSQPDPATMPNLVALPAWRIAIHRARTRELLTFSATIWNEGPAPFSVEGFRRAHSDVMDAYEYFFDQAGNVVGRAPAGTMFYDNDRGHHHWHLRQLASYSLLGPGGRVVLSQKQSFCIAPTDAVDLTLPGAARSPEVFEGLGFGGSVCDLYSPAAIWLREQLPVGWGDTYTQSVAGQAFDITDLPNGRYRLLVRVNPLGVLHETSTADDFALRAIRLSGRRGARRVQVAPWHGING
jgi:hypothetical protein